MRDKVRFLSAMVALMLSAGCAPSGAPSGSDAGGAATGAAPTTPPATVSSPPTSPDAAGGATSAPKVAVLTLFKNVRIFDGKAEKLTDPSNVMVRGNIIERVSRETIQSPADANVTVIDGGGRTLMPGFTTVRDVGGPAFGLKQAIDEGIVPGPRIFPSGAVITITGGHGDFRQLSELPRTIGGPLSRMEQIGASAVADSPDEVRVRVREQLMQGASQIKLAAGGGVSSPHSPIDVSLFTEAELRAAVEAAENWGTYVTVHAFTPAAIQRAMAAGVRCIEHGVFMDEATAKLMAEKGVWFSPQPIPEEVRESFPVGSVQRAKFDEAWQGIARTYELAKKYKLKTAWGTDVLFSQALAQQQGAILASLIRWYTPAEALVMATGTNGQLLAMSGMRNPYPGKLGVVEEGALADLLLVDGNPIEDIKLIANPAKNFVLIMKDGKIYKNTLPK